MSRTEERLIQMRGGQEAREELYRQTRTDLLPLIEKRLPADLRARWDPEDLFHEAFLRAVARLDQFEWRGEGSWRRYVWTIAKRCMIDARKRSSWPNLRLEHGERDGGPRASGVPARDEHASEIVRRREFVSAVFRDMRPMDVRLLELKLLEELDDDEIARRVGKNLAAVRKAIGRAKHRFAKIAAGLDSSIGESVDTPPPALPERSE